jgi:predicted ABC-type ATPase
MASARPTITVIAGVDGAGKSSVAGSALREEGGDYHNPDEVTEAYLARGLPETEANSRAWHRGRRDLTRAVDEGRDFAFETTLGGHTMTELLLRAARNGLRIRMIFIGLESAELHLRRVRARVAHGGHSIPEDRIRQRWLTSRKNLIRLLPEITDLRLFDNSEEAPPHAGKTPALRLLLEIRDRRIVATAPLDEVPDWAKPVLMAAAKLHA